MTQPTQPPPPDPRTQARMDRAARKASRPWIARHKILTGIGALILLIVIISVASSGKKSTPTGSSLTSSTSKTTPSAAHGVTTNNNAAVGDVSVVGCKKDPALDYPSATVKIVNRSSKTSNYIVTVAFDSADGHTQIGTGDATADNLEPGQSTTQTAQGFDLAPGQFVCKVADVTRYASAG